MNGGNMYEWVGYTWNPLAGECPHQCEYCYVPIVANRYPQLREKYRGALRIDERALNQHLPKNHTIFVCSMNDLFAEGVPNEYIERILNRINNLQDKRQFLFQTKYPKRLKDWIPYFPSSSVFATTVETNRNVIRTNAPPPEQRVKDFIEFKDEMLKHNTTHVYEVTIEPIVDFDFYILSAWIEAIAPDFVSIGADSKHNNLSEPSEEKVVELVRYLERFTNVHLKKNLKRLAPSLFEEVSGE